MAVDTAAKRASVLSNQTRLLPPPDSTVAQADRKTLVEHYGGILAGAAAPPPDYQHRTISIPIGIGL